MCINKQSKKSNMCMEYTGNTFAHSVVLLLSRVQLFTTPWTSGCSASLSFTISLSLLRLMSIESVMPSHPLSPPSLPSVFLSIRVFSNELSLCIRWPKYWSFHISPSNEYSRLISFRIDWSDLLAVQGTLKSLLQHQIWKHQFFSTQPTLWLTSYIHTWLLENHSFDCMDLYWVLLGILVIGQVWETWIWANIPHWCPFCHHLNRLQSHL